MVLIIVKIWEYNSKNLLHLQNFYPPESPAVDTQGCSYSHIQGNRENKSFFESDPPRTLSWMFYVAASFSIAFITITYWTDPASKAS